MWFPLRCENKSANAGLDLNAQKSVMCVMAETKRAISRQEKIRLRKVHVHNMSEYIEEQSCLEWNTLFTFMHLADTLSTATESAFNVAATMYGQGFRKYGQ